MTRLSRRLRFGLKHFSRQNKGVVAVEFAMILPLLLIFYLGAFEGSQALSANRKVEAIADTVGNLVSRSTAMDTTRLNNIMAISKAILAPFANTGYPSYQQVQQPAAVAGPAAPKAKRKKSKKGQSGIPAQQTVPAPQPMLMPQNVQVQQPLQPQFVQPNTVIPTGAVDALDRKSVV